MRAPALVAWSVLVGGCSFELVPVAGDAIQGDALDAPGDPPAPACFGGLCRRKALTIDHMQVAAGPHVRFPVLVDLTDPDLAANAATTGFDLTFTASDGTTRLAHERELFAGGRLVAWVAVPTVASATATLLYLYYGDRNATVDGQSPAAVWGAEYQGVWHLEDGSAGAPAVQDSTVRGHHAATVGGATLGAAGKIGLAIELDGQNDTLRVASTASLEQATATATFSLWVNHTAAQRTVEYQRILMTENTFAGDLSGIEWGTQPAGLQTVHYYYPADGGGGNYQAIPNPFTSGQWHHLALTQDFSTRTIAIYVDGVVRAPVADNTPTLWSRRPTPSAWFWGGVPPFTHVDGRLDEIRVATTVRSAGWIATEFANQSSPSTFVLAGPTVVGP